jgi:signal transduction histidine kinase
MPSIRDHSFLLKCLAALGLIAAADLLFYGQPEGPNPGYFALALILAGVAANRYVLSDWRRAAAAGVALGFAVLQFETRSVLGAGLLWCGLAVALLSVRAGPRENAWSWGQRLAIAAFGAPFKLIDDAGNLAERRRRSALKLKPLLMAAVLPAVGGLVFLGLFAMANPLIASAFGNLSWPALDPMRPLVWAAALLAAWSVLRPLHTRRAARLPEAAPARPSAWISVPSVTLSLVVFNALFALQNGLDLAFLWSGAPLPPGVTLKDYAHQGAYTLIATAILAGLFVLVALRPGSESARRPVVRMLVVLSGLISRGVTRPIEGLSAALREVADGRGAIPQTPPTAAVEIRELHEDFRAMAAAIDRRSRYLRDFAAAVSHEFKAPLAGIRGAVELMEDHGDTMSREDRRRFLDAISAASRRLSQLVSRLLDLARADMARPDVGAVADLSAVLGRLADGLSDRGLRVEVVKPPGPLRVAAPESTLEAVLTALVDNSRRAGADRVAITAEAGTATVTLGVSDNGEGVPPGDRERLFEPFFTSRRAHGGTGLGLSIARSPGRQSRRHRPGRQRDGRNISYRVAADHLIFTGSARRLRQASIRRGHPGRPTGKAPPCPRRPRPSRSLVCRPRRPPRRWTIGSQRSAPA